MGWLSDLLFGTKEEHKAIRISRIEEQRRDFERNRADAREDLTDYQQIRRQRFQEILETELARRREREQEAEVAYRRLGLKRSHRMPPKFKPK